MLEYRRVLLPADGDQMDIPTSLRHKFYISHVEALRTMAAVKTYAEEHVGDAVTNEPGKGS